MPSLVRRCALPLSVSVVAGVLTALPAAAVPTWVPAVEVQNDGVSFPGDPVVAVDAEGAATMVWQSFANSDYTVQTSSHPVGGTWSASQDLSGPNAVRGELDLAEDAAGDAVVVWTEGVAPDRVVRVRTRAAGGAWSPTGTLSGPTDSREPSVGIDGSGNAVALWVTDVTGTDAVVGATRSAGGSWTVSFPLSDPENGAERPRVAVAPNGRATAVWTHFDQDLQQQVIETSSRSSASEAFVGRTILSPLDADAGEADVAVNSLGAMTAAWSEHSASGFAVLAATRPAGADWGAFQLISAPADDPLVEEENQAAAVVVDEAGGSTVVWRRHLIDGHVRTVEAASAPAGGTWTPPESLGASNSSGDVELVLDGSGNATAAWPSEGPPGNVALDRKPAGGAWSGLVPIAAEPGRSTGTALAAAPAGDVVVGWSFEPNSSSTGTLEARALDVDGPLTRSLSIPGAGTAGMPVSYAVTPADAWSPVLPTVWSFGDGTSASGATVSHTFATPGSYAVSVTTTDAVGNQRTRSGTTMVSAAPIVTPPTPSPAKPTLTGVKLTKKTIHVVKSDASPRSSTLKLTLDTDATVKVVLKRTKKVDGKAVKATTSKALKKGASGIKLTSKVDGLQLPPGTYKVTVTAKNGVGTSQAVVVTLTIKA